VQADLLAMSQGQWDCVQKQRETRAREKNAVWPDLSKLVEAAKMYL